MVHMLLVKKIELLLKFVHKYYKRLENSFIPEIYKERKFLFEIQKTLFRN